MIYWMKDAAVRYGVLMVLMALDIISGIIWAAIRSEPFSSAKMASGMYKKAGSLVCMVVSDIIYFIAPRYLEINLEIQIYVFLYLTAMETLSIIENVGNNDIRNTFKKLFGKWGREDDDNE